MTIIVNPNGKKLSKRDLNILQFMSQYRDLGYVPEAIFNFLFLLGYTDQNGQEIFTKDEAIKSFDPKRLSTSPAMFDQKKLLWVNSTYIKNMDNESYFEFVEPFLDKVDFLKTVSLDRKKEISLMFKNEINYGAQIIDLLNDIIVKKDELDEAEKEVLAKESSPKVCALFKEKLEKLSETNEETVKNIFKEIKNETGLKGKEIYMPIRIKLTGVMHGIEMYNIIDILGKEETLKRL